VAVDKSGSPFSTDIAGMAGDVQLSESSMKELEGLCVVHALLDDSGLTNP